MSPPLKSPELETLAQKATDVQQLYRAIYPDDPLQPGLPLSGMNVSLTEDLHGRIAFAKFISQNPLLAGRWQRVTEVLDHLKTDGDRNGYPLNVSAGELFSASHESASIAITAIELQTWIAVYYGYVHAIWPDTRTSQTFVRPQRADRLPLPHDFFLGYPPQSGTEITREQAAELVRGVLSLKSRSSPEVLERKVAEIIDSFEGPITFRVAEAGEEFYRYCSNDPKRGSYLTKSFFATPEEAVKALHLDYTVGWKNFADFRQCATAQKPAPVLEGSIREGREGVVQTFVLEPTAFSFAGGRFTNQMTVVFGTAPVPKVVRKKPKSLPSIRSVTRTGFHLPWTNQDRTLLSRLSLFRRPSPPTPNYRQKCEEILSSAVEAGFNVDIVENPFLTAFASLSPGQKSAAIKVDPGEASWVLMNAGYPYLAGLIGDDNRLHQFFIVLFLAGAHDELGAMNSRLEEKQGRSGSTTIFGGTGTPAVSPALNLIRR